MRSWNERAGPGEPETLSSAAPVFFTIWACSMSGIFYWAVARQAPRAAGSHRRRAKPYNIVRDISANGSGQWLRGAHLVKAAPREYEGEHHSRQVQPKWDMRGAAILSTQKP